MNQADGILLLRYTTLQDFCNNFVLLMILLMHRTTHRAAVTLCKDASNLNDDGPCPHFPVCSSSFEAVEQPFVVKNDR